MFSKSPSTDDGMSRNKKKKYINNIKNYNKTIDNILKKTIIDNVRRIWRMARPKRFPEKLVVGLSPELKNFLEKESEKKGCDMNAIVRMAILEYKERVEKSNN